MNKSTDGHSITNTNYKSEDFNENSDIIRTLKDTHTRLQQKASRLII